MSTSRIIACTGIATIKSSQRLCEMNCRYTITDEGKATFHNELKIKADLDLRGECLGKFSESPAGNDIKYLQLPYRAYSESFEEEHRKGICKIMNFLADQSIILYSYTV